MGPDHRITWPDGSWFGRRRLFIGAVGVLILMAIVYFGIMVRSQLQSLATANSDNIQWNMSQAEVDHFAFMFALQDAINAPDGPLDEVRTRFDILYSVIRTIEIAPQYSDLRTIPAAVDSIERARAFLERNVVLFDADDDVLRAGLPAIAADAMEVRRAIRDLALQGISHFSAKKDQSRAEIFRTLLSIAVLSSVLFLLLCVLVIVLNKLNGINHRRARQSELDNSRMSAIVTTSLDAILVVSGDGKIIEFNGAAEEIFGYRKDEAIGRDMADLMFPDNPGQAHGAGGKPQLAEGAKHLVGKGRVRSEARRKTGEVFPVEMSVQTARGENGEVFVSYMRDISKEVEAENALHAARDSAIAGERSKAQLLAVMSHEIRTPLNGLLGTMEILSGTELSDKQRGYLGVMDKSGKILLSHVNDVLDISRLEAGNAEIRETVFDLNALIRDLVEAQAASARRQSNALVFDPETPEFFICADRNRIRQVILNLVGNAIKFTRDGEILVEAEALGRGYTFEIRVIDNGIGIAEEDIGRIFEDFTTLDSSYARKAEGTGLGLGIVRRIVEALGGEIGVESEPGAGSLFWVRLPVGLPRDAVQSESEPVDDTARWPEQNPEQDRRPMDILLVEDNEINRTIASEFLSVDGHRVIVARDGREGIALADERRFDLILMDISMPDIDGIEATRRIRSGTGPSRDTPVMALTAHAFGSDVRRFSEAGMCKVIAKPVSGDMLRRIVANASTDLPVTVQSPDEGILIDTKAMAELRDHLGADKFAEIVKKFCAEMDLETPKPSTIAEASSVAEGLAKTAHRLSGSAAVMGAVELNRRLKRLEHSARSGDVDAQLAALKDVEEAWHRTRVHFSDRM